MVWGRNQNRCPDQSVSFELQSYLRLNLNTIVQAVHQSTNGSVSEVDSQSFQCFLFTRGEALGVVDNVTAAASVAFAAKASEWQPCDRQPRFGELADGAWGVAAKTGSPQSADQLAVTTFVVDSQPPVVEVSLVHSPPSKIHAGLSSHRDH